MITYSNINLTWFALNFVLCTMPPMCIYSLEREVGSKALMQSNESYIGQMYLLWAVHVITFLPKMRIFKVKLKKVDTPLDECIDDDFQRAPDDKIHVLADVLGDDDNYVRADSNLKSGFVPPPELEPSAKENKKHYQRLVRVFNLNCRWTWYIHGALNLVSVIWYCRCHGKELLYAIYIPLDILLNVAVVSFFWIEYFRWQAKNKKKMEKAQKLAEAENVDQSVVSAIAEMTFKMEKTKK